MHHLTTLVILLVVCTIARPAAAVDGAVIVYGLHTPSEEGFERILAEPFRQQRVFQHMGMDGPEVV